MHTNTYNIKNNIVYDSSFVVGVKIVFKHDLTSTISNRFHCSLFSWIVGSTRLGFPPHSIFILIGTTSSPSLGKDLPARASWVINRSHYEDDRPGS